MRKAENFLEGESFQAFQTSCYMLLPVVCPVTSDSRAVCLFSHKVAEILNQKGWHVGRNFELLPALRCCLLVGCACEVSYLVSWCCLEFSVCLLFVPQNPQKWVWVPGHLGNSKLSSSSSSGHTEYM